MNRLMLLLNAAAVAAAPGPVTGAPATPIALSAPVKRDVQCFMLYAIAVQKGIEDKDDKVKEGAGLGVMYYFTKLKTEAPTMDLFNVIKQEAEGMKGGPELKAVGTACDTEFQQAGAALTDLGSRLQQVGH